MADAIYQVEKPCPICEKQFTVTKVRSRLTMVKQDSDFYVQYKEVNPNYYSIWVCPHCGYAAPDAYFQEINSAGTQKIKKFLEGKKVNVNYGGVRTREQALATYKLATFYGELISEKESRLGGLYLKLGWLYREGQQPEEEKQALLKAIAHYEKAPLKERFPIGNLTEISLFYLLGDLFRRTGQLDHALSYLGRVVGDPRAKMEKRVLEMAKELWHKARAEKKALTDAEGKEAEPESIAN